MECSLFSGEQKGIIWVRFFIFQNELEDNLEYSIEDKLWSNLWFSLRDGLDVFELVRSGI